MKSSEKDMAVMLDELGLPAAALRWKELSGSPEYPDFTPEQLLREVIEPQYIETMNNRYKTNLRLSRLIDKSALAENLVTVASGVTTMILYASFCRSGLWKIGLMSACMVLRRRENPTSCQLSVMKPAAGIIAVCILITAIFWTKCWF